MTSYEWFHIKADYYINSEVKYYLKIIGLKHKNISDTSYLIYSSGEVIDHFLYYYGFEVLIYEFCLLINDEYKYLKFIDEIKKIINICDDVLGSSVNTRNYIHQIKKFEVKYPNYKDFKNSVVLKNILE